MSELLLLSLFSKLRLPSYVFSNFPQSLWVLSINACTNSTAMNNRKHCFLMLSYTRITTILQTTQHSTVLKERMTKTLTTLRLAHEGHEC